MYKLSVPFKLLDSVYIMKLLLLLLCRSFERKWNSICFPRPLRKKLDHMVLFDKERITSFESLLFTAHRSATELFGGCLLIELFGVVCSLIVAITLNSVVLI